MSVQSTNAPAETRASGLKKIVAASMVGTVVEWEVEVPPAGSTTVQWSIDLADAAAVVAAAPGAAAWQEFAISSGDSRLARWVSTALSDLDALRMTSTLAPEDEFLAAGAPWFFTLFGRDSIWAARFLLPLSTSPAISTLTALAAAQGGRVDPQTAEQPGKIMHELRAADEHGVVRAELPVALQPWDGARCRELDGGRPERRGGGGVREQHELC